MLKLSTTTRYATRMLIFIAMESESGPVSRRQIEEVEQVTPDYAEQIFLKLKTAGIVRSHRGARGGYTLLIPPDELTVLKVVESLEGVIDLGACEKEECARYIGCAARDVWAEATTNLAECLVKYTIADLACKAQKRRQEDQGDFCI